MGSGLRAFRSAMLSGLAALVLSPTCTNVRTLPEAIERIVQGTTVTQDNFKRFDITRPIPAVVFYDPRITPEQQQQVHSIIENGTALITPTRLAIGPEYVLPDTLRSKLSAASEYASHFYNPYSDTIPVFVHPNIIVDTSIVKKGSCTPSATIAAQTTTRERRIAGLMKQAPERAVMFLSLQGQQGDELQRNLLPAVSHEIDHLTSPHAPIDSVYMSPTTYPSLELYEDRRLPSTEQDRLDYIALGKEFKKRKDPSVNRCTEWGKEQLRRYSAALEEYFEGKEHAALQDHAGAVEHFERSRMMYGALADRNVGTFRQDIIQSGRWLAYELETQRALMKLEPQPLVKSTEHINSQFFLYPSYADTVNHAHRRQSKALPGSYLRTGSASGHAGSPSYGLR